MSRLHLAQGVQHCFVFDAVGTLIYPSPPAVDVYHQTARGLGITLTIDELRGRFKAAFDRYFPEPAVPEGLVSDLRSRFAQEQTIASSAAGLADFEDQVASESDDLNRWKQVVHDSLFDGPHRLETESAFRSLWSHFETPEAWKFYDDAIELLRQLCTMQSIGVAIASNFDSRLHTVLKGKSEFAAIAAPNPIPVFVSSELGFSKPSPSFFRTIQTRIGLPTSQITMVGDHPILDCLGAQKAGWNAIQISRHRDTGPSDKKPSVTSRVKGNFLTVHSMAEILPIATQLLH